MLKQEIVYSRVFRSLFYVSQSKTMDALLDYYYEPNRILLTILGLWPYQERKNIFIRRIIFTLLMMWYSFALMARIFTSHFDMTIVFEMLPIDLFNCAITLMLIDMYFNDRTHKEFWDEIQLDWNSVHNETELNIKKTYALLGRKTLQLIFAAIMTGLIAFMISTSFMPQILDFISPLNETRSHKFPYKVEYFFDQQKHYFITLIIMQGGTVVTALVTISLQFDFFTLMFHIHGLISLTGYRIENSLNGIAQDDTTLNTIYLQSIIICVNRHQRILKFFSLLQSFYGTSGNLAMSTIVIAIVLSLVQITYNEEIDAKPIFQLVVVLLAAFVNCFMFQYLMDNSLKILDKIYFSEWYRISPATRKFLPIMMNQASRPCTFTVFKILIMSMSNLRNVLRLSVSYYTVVSSMR